MSEGNKGANTGSETTTQNNKNTEAEGGQKSTPGVFQFLPFQVFNSNNERQKMCVYHWKIFDFDNGKSIDDVHKEHSYVKDALGSMSKSTIYFFILFSFFWVEIAIFYFFCINEALMYEFLLITDHLFMLLHLGDSYMFWTEMIQ